MLWSDCKCTGKTVNNRFLTVNAVVLTVCCVFQSVQERQSNLQDTMTLDMAALLGEKDDIISQLEEKVIENDRKMVDMQVGTPCHFVFGFVPLSCASSLWK